MALKFAFRVDASLIIGTGHVRRCLTLAESLKENGAECYFIMRKHTGHLFDIIRGRGFQLYELPVISLVADAKTSSSAYEKWLGCRWQDDAEQTQSILDQHRPEWLFVDHYALDARWESPMRAWCKRLAVIDDLANRPHSCDLLLDQNLGRRVQDYSHLMLNDCELLIGPDYALLRSEFRAVRSYSLERRERTAFRHLLISMGGVDKDNVTSRVLEALKGCPLPGNTRVTVVMGGVAPWLSRVKDIAASMPWDTCVYVDVKDMAALMAESDIAIGAAGGSSWERCCLGIPSILIALADNQWSGAYALHAAKAAYLLGNINSIDGLPAVLSNLLHNDAYLSLGASASLIVDGKGTQRVMHKIMTNYAADT